MNVAHPEMSPAFRPPAMRRCPVPSWSAVFAGLVILLAAMAPARLCAQDNPDTYLGVVLQTDLPDPHPGVPGGNHGTIVEPGKGETDKLYKGKDGRLYIEVYDSQGKLVGTVTPPTGSVVSYTSTKGQVGLGAYQNPVVKPDSPPGQFDRDVDLFIRREIPLLTPQSPSVGTAFYSLALPSYLESLGNRAQLFGSVSPFFTTNGVVGFEQGSSLLSILGSSTPDGLTPELFQYNSGTIGFSLSQIDSNEFAFASRSTFVPNSRGTFGLISGSAVPEPTSFIPMLGGIAGVGVWIVLRARARRKKLLVAAR